MEIIQEKKDNIKIFTVKGRLDSNTSSEFENQIYSAIENGLNRMVFNLEELDYISSAGLRVILKTTKELKQSDGKMVLCSLQDYVTEVFEIAGFDRYLNIEKTMENALRSM